MMAMDNKINRAAENFIMNLTGATAAKTSEYVAEIRLNQEFHAVDQKMLRLERRIEKMDIRINQSIDRLTTTLDKFLKRLTDIEDEFTLMKADLKRVKNPD